MKKVIFLLGVVLCTCIASCDNDLDIWNSETFDYSGRFLFQKYTADNKLVAGYSEGGELRIYNTAQNIQNEVFMDDYSRLFPFKSKFSFSGDASSFKSVASDFGQLTNNEYSNLVPDGNPKDANDKTTVFQKFTRCYVQEGKIIPKAATTIGGNLADSIWLKITLYSGNVHFKSELIPEDNRIDPNVAYRWVYDSADHDAAKDSTYILAGHRYTGFPEDQY